MSDGDTRTADRIRPIGRLDLPGGGQVVVQGDLAFVGHMAPPHGTSIIDVSDPAKPRLLTTLMLDGDGSHSHKVRVVGGVMVTNVERNRRHFFRRAERLPKLRTELQGVLGRPPEAAELAAELGVEPSEIAELERARPQDYRDGGFKLWDISDPSAPSLLHHQRTHGSGVHRFDLDSEYAYISTEMDGYVGNILVIYDIREPARPLEISRWWLPGQHVAGGEVPTWSGTDHRLHHAMRQGDYLWAAVWHAGMRVIDISDIRAPKTVGSYDYHPWVVEPTHTFLPTSHEISGRKIALVADEEHAHRHGQPHAGLWVFDVSNVSDPQPISTFHVSELDSPWARAPGRFGLHQFQEHIDGTLVFCAWFAGGLRVVDIADPAMPKEAGYYIPASFPGEAAPQTNDVDIDDRGLVYLIDRNRGFEIVEFME